MPTREIVTLQIGHYSNFIGTHVWNLQSSAYSTLDCSGSTLDSKEINFDTTFREGKTLLGETTYTPRAIFFDLKGSLNTLKQDGVLYDLQNSNRDIKWPENVTFHKFSGTHKNDFLLSLEEDETECHVSVNNKEVETHEKNKDATETHSRVLSPSERFDLDSVVKVWSDFLKPHLHPKSVNILTTEDHANADNFTYFAQGIEAYKEQRSEVEGRLHFFVEECDSLQGFQVLVDGFDAFGGFASHLYEDYIEEEFKNKACFVVNALPSAIKPNDRKCPTHLVNLLLMSNAFTSSSGILPLSTETSLLYRSAKNPSNTSFPFLNFNPSLPYHSSAILATALNNVTLPCRSVKHATDLGDHILSLTSDKRKVLGLQLSLPFALENGKSLFGLLNTSSVQKEFRSSTSFPEFSPLTPSLVKNGRISVQNVTISGLSNEQIYGSQTGAAAIRYSGEEELMQDCLYQSFNTSMNNIHLLKNPCRISEPYPHIFSDRLNSSGIPLDRPNSRSSNCASSVPVATLLQNNDGMVGYLKDILEGVEKIRPGQVERHLGNIMEADDFREKVDQFKCLIDEYEDNRSDMN